MFSRLFLIVFFLVPNLALAAEPPPSWNDGESRTAILNFVDAVTAESSPDFVPQPSLVFLFPK
ncbi:hypothetical protein [Marinobacter changyiensis]|uniref:hypothetical protein n=1 Tax=Marinobacter changyiensis TaxID=2604091 RepID=UPI0012641F48|nr:hypothetical protein [Marinobacter changyiensis]